MADIKPASPHFLKLHRGQPVAFINDKIAREKGIEDGDMVRIFNDYSDTEKPDPKKKS